jgi:hypothetical protein
VSAVFWGKQKFGEVTYDLTHLRPMMLEVKPAAQPDRIVRVVASFGGHTFTKERKDGDPSSLRTGSLNDPRTFCPCRYKYSLQLPGIIEDATRGRVCKSHSDNYLIVRELPGLNGPYAVIFKMEKGSVPGIDARMFVISAHERLNPFPRMQEINFVKLATRIADGLPPMGRK